jgi:hypothetical protein
MVLPVEKGSLCQNSFPGRFPDLIDEVRLIRWQQPRLDQPDQSEPLLPHKGVQLPLGAPETVSQSFYTGASLQGLRCGTPSKALPRKVSFRWGKKLETILESDKTLSSSLARVRQHGCDNGHELQGGGLMYNGGDPFWLAALGPANELVPWRRKGHLETGASPSPGCEALPAAHPYCTRELSWRSQLRQSLSTLGLGWAVQGKETRKEGGGKSA